MRDLLASIALFAIVCYCYDEDPRLVTPCIGSYDPRNLPLRVFGNVVNRHESGVTQAAQGTVEIWERDVFDADDLITSEKLDDNGEFDICGMDIEAKAELYTKFHLVTTESVHYEIGNETFSDEVTTGSVVLCHYGPFPVRQWNLSSGIYEQYFFHVNALDMNNFAHLGYVEC